MHASGRALHADAGAAIPPRYSVPIEIRTVFSPLPASAGAARRFVRDVLMTRRVGDRVVETVELLTSELVTNAVIHARSPAELLVSVGDGVVRIEVSDDDATPPTRRALDLQSASGRGIAIVAELAAEWGVEQVPDDGKRVWFEVPR